MQRLIAKFNYHSDDLYIVSTLKKHINYTVILEKKQMWHLGLALILVMIPMFLH